MLFNKIGLGGGRVDIDPDISVRDFEPYKYTTQDFALQYERYDVLRLQINVPFKILNGTLTIKDMEYSIGNKTVGEVSDIFNRYGASSFFVGYEKFANLPAVLLSNCSNTFTTTLDGVISPLSLLPKVKNKTITKLQSEITSVIVYDHNSNTSKSYEKKGDRIFYQTSKDTKVHITELTKDLYLHIDFGPRRLISEKDVSYLLNFTGEDSNEF